MMCKSVSCKSLPRALPPVLMRIKKNKRPSYQWKSDFIHRCESGSAHSFAILSYFIWIHFMAIAYHSFSFVSSIPFVPFIPLNSFWCCCFFVYSLEISVIVICFMLCAWSAISNEKPILHHFSHEKHIIYSQYKIHNLKKQWKLSTQIVLLFFLHYMRNNIYVDKICVINNALEYKAYALHIAFILS